jgi:hypothetical protein
VAVVGEVAWASMAWLPGAAPSGMVTVSENCGPVVTASTWPLDCHTSRTGLASAKPFPSTWAWLPAGPSLGVTLSWGEDWPQAAVAAISTAAATAATARKGRTCASMQAPCLPRCWRAAVAHGVVAPGLDTQPSTWPPS